MNLLLIRHGESTDNVAGLLAGSRDAPLTTHGVIQARRLGQHLAERSTDIGPVVHVFASDLQRAHNTALEVTSAQTLRRPTTETSRGSAADVAGSKRNPRERLQVETLPLLREKDFGSREGTAYGKRRRDEDQPMMRAEAADSPVIEPETREQMSVRMERFVREHLTPLLASRLAMGSRSQTETVVVVAHGIILNILMRVLLAQSAPGESVRLFGGPEETKDQPPRPAEFSIPWRNTGYVELKVMIKADRQISESAATDSGHVSLATSPFALRVVSVNNSRHLDGLRKTRGGIGSSKFDSKQKTMDSFFSPKSRDSS